MPGDPVARRLAAIMAVDVVGYSGLMGLDEAGTALSLREHREAARPVVAGLGGRIVKTMGDGLLLEFPSVVAAVECALAIQTLMVARNADVPEASRIVYRIGVNLGDVLIEGDDILGEGVNIAARLEGICEPGGVLVSSTAFDHVRGRIEAEFVDLGEKTLKNIARPVRVYAVGAGPKSPEPAIAPVSPGPPRLSLVVLPFANLGGDAEQDYFVDGVTESLTTDLSRIRGAFVIGRNAAFTYKGKAVDLKQIGRELNVRYVLEGSVQRGGSRMRVNVQLIDAETGHHLWAERFDKPLADLFDMQDEIIARLAAALNAQLVEAEARRAEKSPHPDSMDLYFQGEACLDRGLSADNLARARDFFDQAMAADPLSADVQVASARADIIAVQMLAVSDLRATLASAEAKLTDALYRAPDHPRAHLMLGMVYMMTNRASEAIPEYRRAVVLDRNLASAHAWIGICKIQMCRPEETEAHILEALRLSPRDMWAYVWTYSAGAAKFILGFHDQALVWLRRSVKCNRNGPYAHFVLGATLLRLGLQDEAHSAVKAGLALYPAFTVWRFRAVWSTPSTIEPQFVSQYKPLWEAMREAGVPE